MYANDKFVDTNGHTILLKNWKCAGTGASLTVSTARYQDGQYYHKNHVPDVRPDQGTDAIAARVAAVPDSNMRTTDRKFNVAGKAGSRGATGDQDQGSSYGAGAVVVETQVAAPKPPTTVNNINQVEKLHNGTDKYTAADGEAAAE